MWSSFNVAGLFVGLPVVGSVAGLLVGLLACPIRWLDRSHLCWLLQAKCLWLLTIKNVRIPTALTANIGLMERCNLARYEENH
jgi:hypothetical protein